MLIESFDGQRENEEIVKSYYQHPITLLKSGFISILIIGLTTIPYASSRAVWTFYLLLLGILVSAAYFTLHYYLWLNTIYILTNERIFAIVQNKLLMRKNSELPLSNIQHVSHTKSGIFQMILDYGEVEIQTAGSTTAMTLKNLSRPYQAQQKILQQSKDIEK